MSKIQIKVIKDEEDGDTVFEVKANALLATNATTLPQAFEIAKEWIEGGALGYIQRSHHVDADRSHDPVPDDANDPSNCTWCGLAITSDAKHHGFDS